MTKIVITSDDFRKFIGNPSLNVMDCGNLPKELIVPDVFLREYYQSIEYDTKTKKLTHNYEYSRDKFIVTSNCDHHVSGNTEIQTYEYELYNHFLHKNAVFITTELEPEYTINEEKEIKKGWKIGPKVDVMAYSEKEKMSEKAARLLKLCSDIGITAVWRPTKEDEFPITIDRIYKKNEKIRKVAHGMDLTGILKFEPHCEYENISIGNTDILEYLRECDGLSIRIKVELIDKEVVIEQDKEGRSYLVEKGND